MRRVSVVVALAGAVLTAACDSTEPRVPTSVEVQPTAVTVEVGDTAMVTASILDQHGAPFSTPPEDHPITWSSSFGSIASVSNGVITGESPGTATVTVRAGELEPVEVQVTVEPRIVTGEIAFDFSGDRTGSFSISETFRLDDPPSNLAFSVYDQQHNDQDIIGERLREDGLYDVVFFWVDGRVTSTGSRPISGGIMAFGFDLDDGTWEDGYAFASGSATFSAVSPLQLAGTFEMELTDLDEDRYGTLSITAGTFDVPVIRPADFGPSDAGTELRTEAVRAHPHAAIGRAIARVTEGRR
jgi:hypothetical protein